MRALAQLHGRAAIEGLVTIATTAKYPAATRVSAWREILDRAYGRPPQAITGEGGTPLLPVIVTQIIERATLRVGE